MKLYKIALTLFLLDFACNAKPALAFMVAPDPAKAKITVEDKDRNSDPHWFSANCFQLSQVFRNADGSKAALPNDIIVSLEAMPGIEVFTDTNCQTPMTDFTVVAGETFVTMYLKIPGINRSAKDYAYACSSYIPIDQNQPADGVTPTVMIITTITCRPNPPIPNDWPELSFGLQAFRNGVFIPSLSTGPGGNNPGALLRVNP